MMITNQTYQRDKEKEEKEKEAGALGRDRGDIMIIKLIKAVADPVVSLICTMSLFHFVLINFFPHGCRH